MKSYIATELSTFKLPYLLLANQSVLDINNEVVDDCEICNNILKKINWNLYNTTYLCVTVSSSRNEMTAKASECSPSGFLCSKPDSKHPNNLKIS